MKKIYPVIIAALFMATYAYGQDDAQAIKILDSFSSRASKAPSVNMEFRMITRDLTEDKADTVNGSIILSKDKYRLNLRDNIVWYNGETSWNYLTAEKEVTITKPDRKDHSFQNKPSEIFTMYKTGFKSRLIEDKTDSYVIDLYPTDIKSDLVRVRLKIRKSDLGLINLEYKRRDGIVMDLDVKVYNLSRKPEQDEFIFPADKYKDAEINDMR
jgi:outer membrane lipoprotein carrier protein